MTSVTGKALESQRKLATSPMDLNSRCSKPSVPNAWAKGSTNPVTQRPAGAVVANGVTNNQNRSDSAQKSPSDNKKESNTPDRHANDRMTFLLANLIGLQTTITLRSGERYSGIFSSAVHEQSDTKYILKMVKKSADHTNGVVDTGSAYCGSGKDFAMSFANREVVELHTTNVRLDKSKARIAQNGANRFKTDTDISNGFAARERELQPWNGGLESDVSMSLDGNVNGQPWDQFEANERLYGLKSNYDESFYTTTIDKSHPDFKKREAKAAQLAREIEGSSSSNAHIAEERGQKLANDDGADEEDKYSGVRRDLQPLQSGQPNKYTPPARRAPSANTTVTGAPVDPAIISSSLARPSPLASPTPNASDIPPKGASTTSAEEASKTELPSNESSKTPATKSTLPASKLTPGTEGSATATVEKDVVNAFKAFTAAEKLKAQDHQRSLVKRDKAVKLNDLKSFAKNFKLHTEVPSDLIPILAKDKGKQDAIIQKALKNAHDFKITSPKSQEPSPAAAAPLNTTQSNSKSSIQRATESIQPIPPHFQSERRNQSNRQSQSNFTQAGRGNNDRNNQPGPPRGNHAQRLQAQYPRQPLAPMPHGLHDPRLPPTGPSMTNGVQSPPTRIQYNLKAAEFRPNPSASTFQPGPSSQSSPVRVLPPKPAVPKAGNFFYNRRPLVQIKSEKSVISAFDSISRAASEAVSAGKAKDFIGNGGIPQAYRTQPTWDVSEINRELKYAQIFEREKVTPIHSSQSQPHMAHQHQLPMHLQSGSIVQGHTPQHTPRHAPAQPLINSNGIPHYDDHHRMQFSASSSSMHPSPRAGLPPQYVYNGPGSQQVPMHSQPIPPYGMAPGGYAMNMRQVSGGPQYMSQPGSQMGGHVMTHQASSGPYMINSQGPMFAPGPNAGYPHHNGPGPTQVNGAGYSSPRPPAPMMTHQGSQQGHPQMVYMQQGQHNPQTYGQAPTGHMRGAPFAPQAHYGSSPHQQHHFSQPHRATPSGSYGSPMMGTHAMPQPMAPNNAHQMGNEASEDVK